MKELSIFVDESGDFGEYDYHAPYYIISMVFHDQKIDLSDPLKKLETSLSALELSNHCIHAGPVIRQEAEYRYMEIKKTAKNLHAIDGILTKHRRVLREFLYREKTY